MLGVAAGLRLLMLRLSPIPQWSSYHNFADHRGWLGIPNFGNVTSNLAFAIVGVWGLTFLLRLKPQDLPPHFVDWRERWPYLLVFFGMLLTAFSSAYYHLAPNNARLVWDRIPMTIVFGSLVAAVIAERISVHGGLRLLPFLIALGAGSVLQWYADELHGHGDLRFYAAVQAYSTIVLLLALLLPPKYSRGSDIAVVVGLYVLAKVLELADRRIFALGHVVSGHTVKHLVAAAAGYWILRMVQKREPAPS
jgi:hypothetical protein